MSQDKQPKKEKNSRSTVDAAEEKIRHDKKPVTKPTKNRADKPEQKTRSGLSVFALGFAVLAGGALGSVGGVLGQKYYPVTVDNSQQEREVANLKTQILDLEKQATAHTDTLQGTSRTLQTKLDQLDAQIQQLSEREIRTDQPDIAATVTAELEDKFEAISKSISTLTTRLDVVDDMMAQAGSKTPDTANEDTREESDTKLGNTFTSSAALSERLQALEDMRTQIAEHTAELETLRTSVDQLSADLSARPAFPAPTANPIHLPKLDDQDSRAQALALLIDSFPESDMLAAVKAQEKIAAQKPSWLQRTLAKHIKVRDTDSINPVDNITRARQALEDGDVAQAITLINALNPPVRATAQNWLSAAKKFNK
ncbi:MAG TPA: hypothetical protein ENJ46_03060 [Hellea balneolensis]|uniref:Uncharacterized protein n=1 Tax=Hellea balneolensis TaxID=287478 RepID=A0A7C3C1K9_9PROT|nr:hypothetical protein [Hellea balneolensis]